MREELLKEIAFMDDATVRNELARIESELRKLRGEVAYDDGTEHYAGEDE